mgnify:CR=1 FL=1
MTSNGRESARRKEKGKGKGKGKGKRRGKGKGKGKGKGRGRGRGRSGDQNKFALRNCVNLLLSNIRISSCL